MSNVGGVAIAKSKRYIGYGTKVTTTLKKGSAEGVCSGTLFSSGERDSFQIWQATGFIGRGSSPLSPLSLLSPPSPLQESMRVQSSHRPVGFIKIVRSQCRKDYKNDRTVEKRESEQCYE